MKMKLPIMSLAVGLVAAGSAQDVSVFYPVPPKTTRTFASKALEEDFMKTQGGYITGRSSGSTILVADARKDRSSLDGEKLVADMEGLLQVATAYETVPTFEGCPFKKGKEILGDFTKYGAVLLIYDGPADGPTLVTYPENSLVTLNVTPLAGNNFKTRLDREVLRGFVMAAGGSDGPTTCITQKICSLKELDDMKELSVYPGSIMSIKRCAKLRGYARIKTTTYLSACKQGWAPAPTNANQKAIFESVKKAKDEVLKTPTNPIKIKFDPKKGK